MSGDARNPPGFFRIRPECARNPPGIRPDCSPESARIARIYLILQSARISPPTIRADPPGFAGSARIRADSMSWGNGGFAQIRPDPPDARGSGRIRPNAVDPPGSARIRSQWCRRIRPHPPRSARIRPDSEHIEGTGQRRGEAYRTCDQNPLGCLPSEIGVVLPHIKREDFLDCVTFKCLRQHRKRLQGLIIAIGQ